MQGPTRALGRYVRRTAVVFTALAAMGLLAFAACQAPQRGESGQCVFNDDCQMPLICAGRFCRAQCRTSADCVNGWQCSGSGQPGKSVCIPPDAGVRLCVYSSECPPPQVCLSGGVCGAQCFCNRDCEQYGAGAVCVGVQGDAGGTCSNNPALDGGADAGPGTPNCPAQP